MSGSASGVIFTKRGNNHDMLLFKGASVGFSLVWGGSTPIDVTGFSAILTIRNLDGTTLTTFTTGNSRVTIGTTNGIIGFSMTSTDSDALAAGQYTYEIEVTNAAAFKMSVISGKCEIR